MRFILFLVLAWLLAGAGAWAAPQGLEASRALIQDLSERNLELYDRQARASAGSAPVMRIVASERKGRALPGRAPAADLEAYVRLLSRTSPGAVVTGRFADWRAPSVYRSVAGLHNGYDIAYPPGTRIVAGWPGRVTGVLQWYGAEHGITVESPQGFRTTYGHLSPKVALGAWVGPGDVVGTVVNDHVDVKMRDDAGFIDFGRSVPLLPGQRVARGGGLAPPIVMSWRLRPARDGSAALPALQGPSWTRDSEAVRAALAYLRARTWEASLVESGEAGFADLHRARGRVSDARRRVERAGVPEDVLLACFLETRAMREGLLCPGTGPEDAPSEDTASRLQAAADQGLMGLQRLMQALNSAVVASR